MLCLPVHVGMKHSQSVRQLQVEPSFHLLVQAMLVSDQVALSMLDAQVGLQYVRLSRLSREP